jgi:hypothetical protein
MATCFATSPVGSVKTNKKTKGKEKGRGTTKILGRNVLFTC